MPEQAFFVKRGQDVTVIPLTGARLWGLALMIAECSGCQAEYQDSEFTDTRSEETMALTDTNKTLKSPPVKGDATLNYKCN